MASAHLHSDNSGPPFVIHQQPKPATPAAPALPTTSLNNVDHHTTARFPDDNDEETSKPRFQNRVQTFVQQLEHLTYLRSVITREHHVARCAVGWDNQSPYKYRVFQLERILVRFDAAELKLLRIRTKSLQEKLTSEEKNENPHNELNRPRFETPASTNFVVGGWGAVSSASSVACKPATPAASTVPTSRPISSSAHSLNLLTAAIFPAENDEDSFDPHPRARTFDEQLEHLAYLRVVITRECDQAVS